MDADWSVELGADDPALEFPWKSPDSTVGYVDLSQNMRGLERIPEAMLHHPLLSFLTGINGGMSGSPWLSVKCDAWMDQEVNEYVAPYPMHWRMASYVDVIRRDVSERFSFEQHQKWVKAGVKRLHRFPDGSYYCELIVRRCYYHLDDNPQDSKAGFYITVYVFGYGDIEFNAQSSWKGGLDRVAHTLLSVMA